MKMKFMALSILLVFGCIEKTDDFVRIATSGTKTASFDSTSIFMNYRNLGAVIVIDTIQECASINLKLYHYRVCWIEKAKISEIFLNRGKVIFALAWDSNRVSRTVPVPNFNE